MHKLISLAVFLGACGSSVPARIDNISGERVEVATAGSGGSATVVFESGLGMDWTVWDDVASDVATHARVFAYSRPGYGASDPTTRPRDPAQIVEELRLLLAYEGQTPPYLLVGHSNGGGYVELFAKTHPDEVAGVVMVDPRHRDFLATCTAEKLDICGISDSMLADQSPTVQAEYRAYSKTSAEIGTAPFGSYPVRVLTATEHEGSAAREMLWESMLGSLAAEAPNGQQIMVPGAGHVIQVDRPDVVIDTINSLLEGDR